MAKPRLRLFPPHLDSPLTKREAEALASDPSKVASHPFYPFLQRKQRWTQFAPKGATPEEVKVKERPIRYASRRDSYIFGHYRELLNPLYEKELARLGLTRCVLAYRRVCREDSPAGKCNIHFASDAFNAIRQYGNCCAIALDIHQFFENLDHQQLKKMWWRLLGSPVQRLKSALLPEDHFQVFKAVTSYSFIDRERAYMALGLIGEVESEDGLKRIAYVPKRGDFPKQICDPKAFHKMLALKDADGKGILEHNLNPFGIPQGSPISDLLANLYMIDFDKVMNDLISAQGGKYLRYSDDILIILPEPCCDWQHIVAETRSALINNAPRLILKDGKTQIYRFRRAEPSEDQENVVLSASRRTQGLEYLGFRYDGKRIYLRNSTVSGIHRKITALAKRMAHRHVKEHPTHNLRQLVDTFNYDLLISKFGRVKNFDDSEKSYTAWTFWTYVRRSSKILGKLGSSVSRQFKNYKDLSRKKARKALERAYSHLP
jgi:hypothetical protein